MLRDTISSRGGSLRFKQDPITGILLFYDQSRGMYVSTDRETYKFGIDHRNIIVPRWMLLIGKVNSSTNGYLVPRDAIITCITASAQNISPNCIFRIRSTISSSDITTIPLTSQFNKIDNLSININKNDYIKVFIDSISGGVDFPVFTLEIAWR